jgi:hypothetical protein
MFTNKALSSILMTSLLWDINVTFPYLLDTEVAQESDDKDDDDTNAVILE